MKKQKALILWLGVIVSTCILALLLGSCTEEAFDASQTRVFTIQSTSNGATYEIKVGLPDNYKETSEKYATIYVLDGEENFDLVAIQSRKISADKASQNVVVVSIGYGLDRSIDYTPTKVSSVTGGGAQFMEFIETQLIPRIEQDFNVETTPAGRVILGHSYGGLFGACVFAVNNKLFGNYILLSPSIWFDNEVTLQFEKDARASNQAARKVVFVAIGELENSGRMQAPFEAFYQTLRDNYPNIRLGKNKEKNLDHMGSKNPNLIKGLEYYFQNR